jgi:hypothetical protein
LFQRFLSVAGWAISFYVVGALVGGFLVYVFSSNRHDRSVEATMTGAFVLGPAAALLGFLIGAIRAWRISHPS